MQCQSQCNANATSTYRLQGPLSRFGDTAANAGTLSLLDSYEMTSGLNVGLKTVVASAAAASFRIFLMPIDATKTIMQVLCCSVAVPSPLLSIHCLLVGHSFDMRNRNAFHLIEQET